VMTSKLLLILSLYVAALIASALAEPENVCLIPGRASFRVYVDSGGIFGVFAHDHVIEAAKVEGCASVDLQNPAQSSVSLKFAAAELRVLDPKESPEDREKVQKTMETEVLRVREYPVITFESTGVTADASDRFRVRGNLTIRGKTAPVAIPVIVSRLDDGSYRVTGSYKFKQSLFGIEPIRLMGGTVRVKDEVRTEFDLFLK
jgi:polyisoprenoid-binding protein YceI